MINGLKEMPDYCRGRFPGISVLALLFFLLLGVAPEAVAQDPPKRELRAAWLTTVWGLDWPGVKIPAGGNPSTVELQKQQLVRILDSMKITGMNALFFQVRPECDAFYPSSYEPWSAHLSAARGVDPGWDPLAFAVAESHKRGMELHAWLNPYRFESVAGKYAGQPGDYRQSHPEWVLTYTGGGSILDPGNPGVRTLIAGIVREIVTNYDVDGIVFDDYFYAYEGTSSTLDQYAQERWRPAGMDLGDWRRDNVNRMVAGVFQAIKEVKPWVTFGVSPFGIWTTDSQVAASRGLELPRGITGMDAYKSIYCDPVAWLAEGTVDYISPQIYWPTTSTNQDFDILSPWWSGVVNRFGRHLYVSHSLSGLDPSDYPPPAALKAAFLNGNTTGRGGLSMMEYYSLVSREAEVAGYDPSEFGLQVARNRLSDLNGAPGSVFFRSTMFFTKGIMNYFRTHEYRWAALPPVKSWNSLTPLPLPQGIRLEGNRLVWDPAGENLRYAVYAVPTEVAGQAGNFSTGRYLVGISYTPFIDLADYPKLLSGHQYAVSALDRNGNASPVGLTGASQGENQPVELISPAEGARVYTNATFSWSSIPDAELYILEVAADPQFSEVRYRREISAVGFPLSLMGLREDTLYYWRVYTRMAGTPDAVTPGRFFRLVSLPRPVVLYPQNEATGVEVRPVVAWKPMEEGYTFRIQISGSPGFTTLVYEKKDLSGTSFPLPAGALSSYGVYYLRMQGVRGDTATLWSETVKFSTLRIPPQVPRILSPGNGTTVIGPGVTLTTGWDERAGGFTFQWSSSSSFPWNNVKQQTVSAPDTVLTLPGLGEGTWYARVRATYSSGLYTDWSPAISFTFVYTASAGWSGTPLSLRVSTPAAGVPAVIRFALPAGSRIHLRLKDIAGREVALLEQGMRPAGEHTVVWQGGALSPGIYMVVLETEWGRKVVKMVRP
ncbi:MAG TPA: family 10 glycosylhydrolase [Prolixibacteraceae bacterium]|nr:family 10 glycosylhydrolase [Prolixibacteraceae bacterium]